MGQLQRHPRLIGVNILRRKRRSLPDHVAGIPPAAGRGAAAETVDELLVVAMDDGGEKGLKDIQDKKDEKRQEREKAEEHHLHTHHGVSFVPSVPNVSAEPQSHV